MTEDQDTLDGNAVFKHMQKLHSEREFRQRFNKLDYLQRTPKQVQCFDDRHKFLALRAGNRSGKTEFACSYTACALLDRWPKDYAGYQFIRPNIARSTTFNAWMIGPTGVNVRDVQQAKLLGGLTPADLGTGWLPLSALRHPINLSRGASGLADKVLITRDDGSLASLVFKTHEMSREAFQGDAVDLGVLDEDPGRKGEEIWPELTARIIGTGGRIIHTATPLAGISAVRKFFKEPGHPERGEIRMSIYDNTFLTKEDIALAEASYSERERATRLFGDDLPGFGAVFNFAEDTYLHDLNPRDIVSDGWRWINAMDFSHNGLSSQAHPWAFVSCAVSPNGTVFVMDAIRIKQQLPGEHFRAMKQQCKMWDAPCAWGADGNQRANERGDTFCQVYRDLGVPMLREHATMREGGVSLEGSHALLERMFADGSLKIARHLHELREEIRELHYDDKNRYVPEADDIASAMRYAVMSVRYARRTSEFTGGARAQSSTSDSGQAFKWEGNAIFGDY